MKKLLCIIYLISCSLSAQKMYCTKDSVPVYSNMNINSLILGWTNKDELVKNVNRGDQIGAVNFEGLEYTQVLFWVKVTTMNNVKGWSISSHFVSHLYEKPQNKLQIDVLPEGVDEVYPIGWSKNGKYYAYMVSGYIDGGMDGLTVRFYILNTSNNYIEKKVVSYTSYETPIADAWKNYYGSIQTALCEYAIIQDTNRIQLQKMPVTTEKRDSMSVTFEITDTLTKIYLSYLASNTGITAFNEYIADINCIGWLKCPYDKNKYIVYTTSNRGSSDYYVQALGIDMKMLRR